MKKLNLVAMSYDRDRILNALERTGAVELKEHSAADFTHTFSDDCEELRTLCFSIEGAIDTLSQEIFDYAKENGVKIDPSQTVEIAYSDFMAMGARYDEAKALVQTINDLTERKNALNTERNRLNRALKNASAYRDVTAPFSSFAPTRTTACRLESVSKSAWNGLKARLDEIELAAYTVYSDNADVVFAVAAHKSVWAEVESRLSEFGALACPYTEEKTGEELVDSINEEIKTCIGAIKENAARFYALSEKLEDLKAFGDYALFALEKAELSEKMLATERTFLLEAYLPAEAEEGVRAALTETTGAMYLEISPVPDDEVPPTLLKNNAVVENFEVLTNMYSVPNSREFDPNTIMSVFYSIFLGFILADVGYGLLMFLCGGFLWLRSRKTGAAMGRLTGVFAIGGIFAVIWGVLFNSYLGFFIPAIPTVMPNAEKARWTFIGIQIPSVLIFCMLMGVVHLFAGYICRAVQCWRRGQIWDGIFDGVVWAVFSVGVMLAVLGLIEEFHLSFLTLAGGITAGASLLVAMLTAGRKEKFLGKFTKGFGAAYGIINYASDILSYSRLYGLMLSGAIIAEIVSENAVKLIAGGNFGLAIIGVLLLPVGHLFNLAIGLLGAYIHDARLQYVEFYGRFFEGEGELFTPIGSNKKYVRVLRAK